MGNTIETKRLLLMAISLLCRREHGSKCDVITSRTQIKQVREIWLSALKKVVNFTVRKYTSNF